MDGRWFLPPAPARVKPGDTRSIASNLRDSEGAGSIWAISFVRESGRFGSLSGVEILVARTFAASTGAFSRKGPGEGQASFEWKAGSRGEAPTLNVEVSSTDSTPGGPKPAGLSLCADGRVWARYDRDRMSETSTGRHGSGKTNPDSGGASWAEELAARLERESPEGVVIGGPPPSSGAIGRFVEDVRRFVFPGVFCEGAGPATAADVERADRDLTQLLEMSFTAAKVDPAPKGGVDAIVRAFLDGLPALRDVLAQDAQAAYDGDPAARSPLEVVLCYPGLDAVFAYRIAHALLHLGAPLLPRMITEQSHTRTGVDIHPGAEIGPAFFVDHASGVVIGETTKIGANVTIYQGVTLGAKSFPKDANGRVIRGVKRHPTIGDRVTIYAGAIILGGDTEIGDDCIVSANVHCTKSAPAGHIIRQKHGELQLLPRPELRN